jgi:hypothetical protein
VRRGEFASKSRSPLSNSNLSGGDFRLGLIWLDGVLPFGLAGDDVGVEVEKKGLAGAILRLVEDGKIKLPPSV